MDYEIITPVALKYLERITISRSSAFGHFKCELVLCDENQKSSVTAVFEGLGEFEITKEFGLPIGPLKALDMRDRQWQNVNYQVRDYENRVITFYCRAFSIKEQEPMSL